MDTSTRNLHSITHSKLQGSNIPIPSSSVTLGYTPSAMAAQPQNNPAFAPANQASYSAVLPASSATAHPPFQAPGQQYHYSQNPASLSGVPMQPSSSTAPAPASADSHPHQPTGSGGPLATAPFLRDFSLVAEAAKRAQMSVVLRDLESVTL
ncbi:uncharacterized protein ACLA_041260 [Aspergillus clavatus NRRL 1]|uniref:Uncharacterized protein n=1 Tax=Aspergillus clavatus (strain ATCC 1007 / CBS 513.65 / DSM 816 / NCTC 3887 / NRRL 1 / QM 1276 / 107) TaxID=344612 RepID=A1CL84_ASPCL|nr:uncharacterized protein ACLA_041260 [Aspergillus clavatus NRRL 1]EAW09908.1 conserved hypothetical protein [Aspergillus clavatus NRRL 1]